MSFDGVRLASGWVARLRRSRLAGGSAVNLVLLVMTLTVQLVSVPILSAALGLQLYGVWLVISTVPTYLMLSDFGLLTAAQSEMAMKAAAGEEETVASIFQSVFVTTSAVAVALTMVLTLLIALTAPSGIWPDQLAPHVWAIPVLAAYAALYLIACVPVTALRATGYYARANMLHGTSIFVESLSTMAVAAAGGNLVAMAAAPLAIRVVTTILIYFEMRRLKPFLRAGLDRASWDCVKRLLPAAAGNLAIPVALTLSLQGTVLVVAAVINPIAVAIFVPVRTASRFPVQLIGVFGRAALPELSAARGRGDAETERRVWSIKNRLTLLILIPAALLFALFGSEAVSLWTGGRITPPRLFVAVMALTIPLHSYWYYRFLLLTASHEHIGIARYAIIGSAATLVLAALAAEPFGLAGVAGSLGLVDLCLSLVVDRHLRRRRRPLAPNPAVLTGLADPRADGTGA